ILVLLSGVGGYVLWRINQAQTLSGTDTSAGGQGGSNCSVVCKGKWKTETRGKCPDNTTNRILNVCTADSSCNYYSLCTDQGRYHCCDGTWAIGTSGDNACGKNNYSNCNKKVTQCTCASYSNCGRDCVFPAGTADIVKQKAQANCSTVMAFCVIDGNGNTKITYGDPGKCDPKVCNNPTSTGTCNPNVCDGGGLISPTSSTVFSNGDKVTFKGYAFDTDGVDTSKINVSVDGTVVGQATAVDACGASGDATICSAHPNAKPVIWSYVYTSNGGTHQLSASWADTKGVTGGTCKTATSITGQTIQDNWVISKVGVPACIKDDPANPFVRINYTISVRNSASQSKNIDKIVDTLDSKVLPSYILVSSINPGATLNGRVITWDLSGTDSTFTAGQTKTYRYTLEIPDTAFGTYTNTVVVTPEASSAIHVDNSLVVSCTRVPTTGLFDSTIVRVVLGLVLIGFGFAYLYSDSFQSLVLNVLGKVSDPIFNEEVKTERRRSKFERKLVKK
ncbi:MAG TPA: hypothetical protein VHA74_03660, partial [Candidatus Dojkabacteria bacterium]|nr:hypothetical protein [Candidatus Dojkabacteria bacterium]